MTELPQLSEESLEALVVACHHVRNEKGLLVQIPFCCMNSMPEDERSGLYDPDEEYAWDQDNAYPLDDDRLEDDED